MISRNDLEKIKKTVEEFFEKTTFKIEVEVLPEKENTLPINLNAEEPQILIGEGGQTLSEIQHLLKAILRKKIATEGKLLFEEQEEPFYINVDINDYKKKKIEYLKELARDTADEVFLTKKEKILNPMPAYERRVIHLELAERSDVVSESIGEEPERKVVIKPSPR